MTPDLIAALLLMSAFIGVALAIKKWSRIEEREKAASEIIKGDLDARRIDDEVARGPDADVHSELLRNWRRKSVRPDEPDPDK